MVPTKRFIMRVAIITIICFALLGLFMGWLMHYPLWSVKTLIVESIIIGASVIGVLIGWLLLRAIYPQSQDEGENQEAHMNSQSRPGEGIHKLNFNDAPSLHRYDHEHSPQIERSWKLLRWLFLVAVTMELLAAAVLVAVFDKQYLPFVLGLCVLALMTFLWWIFAPRLRKRLRR